MSLTVYSDIILSPRKIGASLQAKVMRNNTRVQTQSGYQSININWTRSLRQFTFGVVPMPMAAWGAIRSIFELTEGGAYGLLLEDPSDFRVSTVDGFLQPLALGVSAGAIGLGYGVPTMQLNQRITYLSRTKDRPITRPRATSDGTVIYRGGAAVAAGASPGNVAVNADTGVATFVADSSSTVTNVTVGSSTAVTLTAALAGLAIGGRLYLAGLTGADSAFLNGQSWQISNISGGGLNVYTLAVATTGKTITAAGSGYKYPQASESLKWAGRFYLPVHFHDDWIDWELVLPGGEDQRLFAGPSVILDEIRE